MGNCNSSSSQKQACKGCGMASCTCTSGLDKICGSCPGDRKYHTPGTYDSAFNNWVARNPKPVPPAMEELVPISFKIECAVCSQIIQQGDITAGSIEQGQIDQTMDCFNKKLEDAKSAAASEAANAKSAAEAKAAADKKAALDAIENKKGADSMMMYIFIGIFIVVVILAYVAYSFSGDSAPATAVPATPMMQPQPVMMQQQVPQPQFVQQPVQYVQVPAQ
jgi:hypothetical protein